MPCVTPSLREAQGSLPRGTCAVRLPAACIRCHHHRRRMLRGSAWDAVPDRHRVEAEDTARWAPDCTRVHRRARDQRAGRSAQRLGHCPLLRMARGRERSQANPVCFPAERPDCHPGRSVRGDRGVEGWRRRRQASSSIHPSIHPSIHLSIHLSIHPPVRFIAGKVHAPPPSAGGASFAGPQVRYLVITPYAGGASFAGPQVGHGDYNPTHTPNPNPKPNPKLEP